MTKKTQQADKKSKVPAKKNIGDKKVSPKSAAKAEVTKSKKPLKKPEKKSSEKPKSVPAKSAAAKPKAAPAAKASERPVETEVDIMSHPKLSLKPTKPTEEGAPSEEEALVAPKPENLAPLKPSKEKGPVPSLAELKLDKNKMSEDQLRWYELFRKHRSEPSQTYEISKSFEARKPLDHKLFGWGYILTNEYDRLEVLFKEGKKILISNRKV